MGKSDKKTKTAAAPAPVVAAAAAPAKAKKEKKSKAPKKEPTPPPVESSSSEEDEESSDEEEESKAAQVKTAAPAKKVDAESSDDESSEEESTPAAAAASESSSDEDSSDDEEETPAPAVASTKRKASPDAAAAPEKKAKQAKPLKTPTELTSNPPSKTLWIGNLSWNVDQPFLKGEFDQFGEIIGTRIQMDRETGRSRGIGYVEFADDESAQKAFAEGQKGMVVDGREIRVDWATQREPNAEGRAKAFGDKRNPPAPTLWVGNLSFDLTEDAIWEAFSEHGQVSNVRMPMDRDTGNPKGFAYVEFASTDSASKALDALNGKDVGGRNCRIDFAPPRSEGGGDRGGRGGGRGGDRGGRGGFGGRGGRGGGDRGGGFGGRGRGSDRGFGDRGGRGGGRGRGNPARTGGISEFAGTKKSFDN